MWNPGTICGSTDSSQGDIFVHLAQVESFGLGILEAYSRGLKVVVNPGTFLDDLPDPQSRAGVFRVQELTGRGVAEQIRLAAASPHAPTELFEIRKKVSELVQPGDGRQEHGPCVCGSMIRFCSVHRIHP